MTSKERQLSTGERQYQNYSGFSSSQSAEGPWKTTTRKHNTMHVVFVLLSHEIMEDVALSGGHLPR